MFQYARTNNICGLLCLQDMDKGYQLPENALFYWYKNQVKIYSCFSYPLLTMYVTNIFTQFTVSRMASCHMMTS
jgi:hypothetical protein